MPHKGFASVANMVPALVDFGHLSKRMISDIERVLGLLHPDVVMPEIEVELDEESVILRWADDNFTETFSLTFLGHGEVTGFHLTAICPQRAWKLNICAKTELSAKLNCGSLNRLLVANSGAR